MHAACDSELKASLLLADFRYCETKAQKSSHRCASRKSARLALETRHYNEEKA